MHFGNANGGGGNVELKVPLAALNGSTSNINDDGRVGQ